MTTAPHIYRQIIEEQKLGRNPVAVFDLDSTLFDVSPRTQKILDEFLNLKETLSNFPNEVNFLTGLKIQPQDWGLRQSIERSGLKTTLEFQKKLRDFWRAHFFSSNFLLSDRPYDGAIEYVRSLAEKQIEIYYLTGRDEKNMKAGTIESLKYHKLPLLSEHTHLIMKPEKGSIEDEDFKEVRLRALKSKFSSIWFFENEPVIIERLLSSKIDVKIIWIDTTHSGKANPPTGLPVIKMDSWST